MTIGKNELFVRKIENGKIIENYDFHYYNKKITLENEIKKARLGKISENKKNEILKKEKNNECVIDIKITKKQSPVTISIPNENYCYYNKAENDIIYVEPKWVVYWEKDGTPVYTFKRNGNWYLRGIGGKKYFGRECITWGLISEKIKPRYLPKGFILDNSSPIAVMKDDKEKDLLFFIMGWMLTDKFNEILKTTTNHTKNIQGKDIERMPFPYWATANKTRCVKLVKLLIKNKKQKNIIDENILKELNILYIKGN